MPLNKSFIKQLVDLPTWIKEGRTVRFFDTLRTVLPVLAKHRTGNFTGVHGVAWQARPATLNRR
jgi:hypothetical protein